MHTIVLAIATFLITAIVASAFIVLDYKFMVGLVAFFQKPEDRPEPSKRKGVVAGHTAQWQFWVAVIATILLSFVPWLSAQQDGLDAFLVFVVRVAAFWVLFLYSSKVVKSWDNRKEVFDYVGRLAQGDNEALGAAVRAGAEKIDAVRGKSLSVMDRIRNFIASFLVGVRKTRAEFEEVRKESVAATVPASPAPAPVTPVVEEAPGAQAGINAFLRGDKEPKAAGTEGGES